MLILYLTITAAVAISISTMMTHAFPIPRAFETLYDEEDETRLKLRNGSAKIKIRADDAHIRLNDITGL